MLQHLKNYFGYDSFRPLQEEVIMAILKKKDVLLLMPTGGGKSICYQLPALMQEGTCLVISPLIALMRDQVLKLHKLGICASFLNSSQSVAEESEVIEKARSGHLKLLYLSPEKAVKLTREFLEPLNISLIAIDEAHCISGWGHDFRPEYGKLQMLRSLLPEVNILAVTATADKVTRRDILSQLQMSDPEIFVASFDRPNISLKTVMNKSDKEKIAAITDLAGKYESKSGIVYCLSRQGTEKVASSLKEAGLTAAAYHAGMPATERNRVQESFLHGDIQIVAATIAFGMGIDKPDIRFVVHYNLPKNLESYYQETGRAGRDGLPAETILFYGYNDLRMLREFAGDGHRREFNLEKLNYMLEFAGARICRRKILLHYFSESMTENCGNCDICNSPPALIDGKELAQKAISASLRLNEKVSSQMLIQVLRGSQTEEVLEKGFQKIKTFGAGSGIPFDTWRGYLIQFIQLGLFEIAYDENNALKVTPFGKVVLTGNLPLYIVRPDPAKPQIKKRNNNNNSGLYEGAQQKEENLFEVLKKHRKDLAAEERIPAFLIFTDHTLRQMERFQPESSHDLLKIPGISENKCRKYGASFLSLIAEFRSKHGYTPPPPPAERIQVSILHQYLKEMIQAGSQLTYTQMSHILMANEKAKLSEGEKAMTFYGKMADTSTAKALKQTLKNFFTAFVDEPLNDRVETFFSPPLYNHLDENQSRNLFREIRKIPQQRSTETINNDYITEQRLHYPRAYEPWSETERNLFISSVEKTNDLFFLARAFQRNPGSLKQVFRKMKTETASQG